MALKGNMGAAVDFFVRKGNNPRVSLVFLAAVNVIIWTGLFVYLWRLDRRISARERER
jgi:CcmD family protein